MVDRYAKKVYVITDGASEINDDGWEQIVKTMVENNIQVSLMQVCALKMGGGDRIESGLRNSGADFDDDGGGEVKQVSCKMMMRRQGNGVMIDCEEELRVSAGVCRSCEWMFYRVGGGVGEGCVSEEDDSDDALFLKGCCA